jgi:hypothetical protein
MRSLFRIILVLAAVVLLWGCENPLDIPVRDIETQLTLNTEVHPDENFRVLVTYSKKPLSNGAFDVPKNAVVNLYEDGTYLETLAYNPNDTNRIYGNYKSKSRPKAASEYQLEVILPGYNRLTATEKIPRLLKIDQLETIYYPGDFGQDGQAKFQLRFNDNPEAEYYLLYVFYQTLERTGSEGPDSLEYRYFSNTRRTDLQEAEEDFTDGIIFSDATFNGQEKILNIDFTAQPVSFFADNRYKEVRLFFELRRISRDNFLYRKSYTNYVKGANNGFGEPVIVHTNVKNGLGIFSSFTRDFAAYKIK